MLNYFICWYELIVYIFTLLQFYHSILKRFLPHRHADRIAEALCPHVGGEVTLSLDVEVLIFHGYKKTLKVSETFRVLSVNFLFFAERQENLSPLRHGVFKGFLCVFVSPWLNLFGC